MKKKKSMKRLAALILVVMLILASAGCGSGNASIVGQWNVTEGNKFRYLEFFSDGTYTSSHSNYHGDYSIDGDRLMLSGVLVEPRTYTFKIQSDTLSLYYNSESESPTMVFERAD